jgi:hypothetical protein
MSLSDIPDINIINDKYKKIIDNYRNYNLNIKNINDDIKNLENIHHVYINSGDMSSVNYSVYVDDIKHQINITRLEYDYINNIYILNVEKLYRDLFKLYTRITKLLLNIFKENKDTIIRLWKSTDKFSYESTEFKKLKKNIRILADNARSNNPSTNDEKIFDEIKKQYYVNIIIYNEMYNAHNYTIDDVVIIYENLMKRFEELILSRELITLNLIDLQSKTEKGILGQTFVMDLNGKSDRIKVDYAIMVKLLESTITMNLNLAEKYNNVSKQISEQVKCDDTSTSTDSTSINDDIFLNK